MLKSVNMKKHSPKDNGVQMPFDNNLDFINKWQDWLEYRKERRLAAYVPRGLKGTFANLVNISGNDPKVAMQIIQRSMDNNWQGLFALPQNYSNGQGNINNGQPKFSDDKLKEALFRNIANQ
jgi:hypothetical protein